MNKLILIPIIIVMVIALYFWISTSIEKEVDTSETNCINRTSSGSVLTEPMIDMICDSHCRSDLHITRHAHTYHAWRCSNQDTLICVCNR